MVKGAISIETIIIIILAVLTLVIVAAAFSGGMKELWGKITGIWKAYEAIDPESAKVQCQAWCTARDKTNFCRNRDIIDPITKAKESKNCEALLAEPCPEIKC